MLATLKSNMYRLKSRPLLFSRHRNVSVAALRNWSDQASMWKPRRRFHSTPFYSAPDHYQILGVSRHASAEEIKRNFYLLAKRYHPGKLLSLNFLKLDNTRFHVILILNEQVIKFTIAFVIIMVHYTLVLQISTPTTPQ